MPPTTKHTNTQQTHKSCCSRDITTTTDRRRTKGCTGWWFPSVRYSPCTPSLRVHPSPTYIYSYSYLRRVYDVIYIFHGHIFDTVIFLAVIILKQIDCDCAITTTTSSPVLPVFTFVGETEGGVLILFFFCFGLLVSITMTRRSVHILSLSLIVCHTLYALSLEPGVGFRSRDGSMHVVLFEHTEQYGSGGLVLNQPTPLRLKDLHIPLFHEAFADNSLMLGGGMTNDKETNVAITDMAPWFWLHTVPNLPKSTPLSAAEGPLYIGGSIDVATEWIQEGNVSLSDFKFFYKYKQWGPGELIKEIAQQDFWIDVGPVQAKEAVKMYSFPGVF